MRYDIHVHVATASTPFRANWRVRAFARHLKVGAGEALPGRLVQWAQDGEIDRFVLLAMDRPHGSSGKPLQPTGLPVVSNACVAELAGRSPRFLFGASIHPARTDALAELDWCMRHGACLVKWIPSSQNIHLDAPYCIPFYESLAAHRMPLLVHTGCEHVTGGSLNALNDLSLLAQPLRRGVTVIAAHCGARMYLHEPCYFASFTRLVLEHEHLYGDLGAFGIPTRIPLLRRLQRRPELLDGIVYGSDFPAFVMPRSMVFWIGVDGVRQLLKEGNPLQRPRLLLRLLGLPDAIFTRAGSLLRLPPAAGGVA